MDYSFISMHRKKFNELMEQTSYYDKRDVLAAYDKALVETILESSESKEKQFDAAMDKIYNAMNKPTKGEGQ